MGIKINNSSLVNVPPSNIPPGVEQGDLNSPLHAPSSHGPPTLSSQPPPLSILLSLQYFIPVRPLLGVSKMLIFS